MVPVLTKIQRCFNLNFTRIISHYKISNDIDLQNCWEHQRLFYKSRKGIQIVSKYVGTRLLIKDGDTVSPEVEENTGEVDSELPLGKTTPSSETTCSNLNSISF